MLYLVLWLCCCRSCGNVVVSVVLYLSVHVCIVPCLCTLTSEVVHFIPLDGPISDSTHGNEGMLYQTQSFTRARHKQTTPCCCCRSAPTVHTLCSHGVCAVLPRCTCVVPTLTRAAATARAQVDSDGRALHAPQGVLVVLARHAGGADRRTRLLRRCHRHAPRPRPQGRPPGACPRVAGVVVVGVAVVGVVVVHGVHRRVRGAACEVWGGAGLLLARHTPRLLQCHAQHVRRTATGTRNAWINLSMGGGTASHALAVTVSYTALCGAV